MAGGPRSSRSFGWLCAVVSGRTDVLRQLDPSSERADNATR